MINSDLLALSLGEVALQIQQRRVSPVTVTESVLERIDSLDSQLNTFITVMHEDALDSARNAEAEIAHGTYLGPLHGVPVSLKDLFFTKGVRTTAGSRILANFVPEQDATVVKRLREGGAVLIGKTNMLEFAYGEVHPDYGPSRNPWNPIYGTSGSSSGSGAAVAAGLGYGSIGSDTGGSIRFPAAYCGIVGLKPTYGMVSRAGAVPLSWSLDHVGPMARTVKDCAILLDAIAGYDPADPTSARMPAPSYASSVEEPTPDITLGVLEPAVDDGVTPEVRRATDAAVAAIENLGFKTTPIELPHLSQATRAMLALLYAEASAYHEPWLRSRPDEYCANTRDRLELGTLLPATLYLRASRVRQLIVDVHRELFGRIDILVTPVSPFASYLIDETPSEPIGKMGDRMLSLTRFTGPFNLTGQPALTVPSGLGDNGLPIGVQLVGRPFEESLLFQVATLLERELAGAYRGQSDEKPWSCNRSKPVESSRASE
jgi:aspartyl-tRNA(Asn)/glutamyl-tRNA(Gln) amidotransferase subunit A